MQKHDPGTFQAAIEPDASTLRVSSLRKQEYSCHPINRAAGSGRHDGEHRSARVHLWFEQKFGAPFTPLSSAAEMLGRYASKTHAVAARLAGDEIEVLAPFGLDHIFSFRVVPNPILRNRAAHEKKAARAKAIWRELTVEPWRD